MRDYFVNNKKRVSGEIRIEDGEKKMEKRRLKKNWREIKYNKLFQQFELKSVDGSAANLMGTLEFVWAYFAPPWNLSLIWSCPFFLPTIKYGKKGDGESVYNLC